MINLNKNELKDIAVFLNAGSFSLNVKQSILLLTLINRINENVKLLEEPNEEKTKTDKKTK